LAGGKLTLKRRVKLARRGLKAVGKRDPMVENLDPPAKKPRECRLSAKQSSHRSISQD
jgi:hypothetical protein